MSKDSKRLILNCSVDLQRAAKFYYLDPLGSTYRIFLDHAIQTLSSLNEARVKEFLRLIEKLRDVISQTPSVDENGHIADKLLTAGVMLKGIV